MKQRVIRDRRATWALLTSAVMLQAACARTSPDSPSRVEPQRRPPVSARSQALAAAALGDVNALADVAERVMPAVVSVASKRVVRVQPPDVSPENPLFRFFGPEGRMSPFPLPPGSGLPEQQGLGSGVLVAKNLILTNAHVVEGADKIEITAQDGRALTAELVGSDPKSDLAVLRVTSDTTGLSSLEFADSSRVRLGQLVLAVGNPFGVGQTVTMGIVSAKGRANLGIVDYEDFIQTDAAINPGNSGGALVDLDGRLLGIPTAILSRTGGYMGVGFAIPSNMARPIMVSLIEHGRVARGFLGVTVQEVDADIASALKLTVNSGVLLADVAPGGPAATAGVQRGDVIVSVDAQRIQSKGQFRNLIAAAGVGRNVTLEVLRAGKARRFRARLGESPPDVGPSNSEASP